MLKKLKLLFAIITVIWAIYSLIDNIFYFDSSRTDQFNALPFMNFFLGLFFLIVGLSELQAKRRSNAIMCFITSALNISVSIYMYPVFF